MSRGDRISQLRQVICWKTSSVLEQHDHHRGVDIEIQTESDTEDVKEISNTMQKIDFPLPHTPIAILLWVMDVVVVDFFVDIDLFV